MGDWLELVHQLMDRLNDPSAPELAPEQLVEELEGFVANVRSEREDKDWAVSRAATLQEEAIQLRREVGRLQGQVADREADLRAASGDLPVTIPEPGTDLARVLSAVVLLRRDLLRSSEALASTGSSLASLRLLAGQAVAIVHRLHQEEGLDLDGEVTLLMARVRVGSGGGCGVCPLRKSDTSHRGQVRSTCDHPEVLASDLVTPAMSGEVTRSQREEGPPPRWCPLLQSTEETAVWDESSLDSGLTGRLESLAASLRAEGRPVEGAVCHRAVHVIKIIRGDEPYTPQDSPSDQVDRPAGLPWGKSAG